MNATAIAIASAVFFILVMFWHSLKANLQGPSDRLDAVLKPRDIAPGEPSTAREPEAIDLRQFLCALQADYETTLERLGIRLAVELPAMPLTVAVRKGDLRRLFAHIIRALCDAPEAGVTLRILARSDGRQAVVNCFDAGTAEPRLARDFMAAGPAGSPGVAACRSIVDAHGGRLYAAPSPLGQPCLTLRLPLLRTQTSSIVGSP